VTAAGLPVLPLEVDVAHVAVERELGRVDDRRTRLRPVVREVHHVAAGTLLDARRVAAEHEDWAVPSVADSRMPCQTYTVLPRR